MYKRQLCEESFSHNGDLEKHIRNVHTRKKLKLKSPRCYLCCKNFKTLKTLEKHNNCVHRGLRSFICDICDKIFKKPKLLTIHKEMHLNEEMKKYVCNPCKKSFDKPELLKKHISSVHNTLKIYRCEFCCKTFTSEHVLKHHTCNIRDEEYQKDNKCYICYKTLRNLRVLKNHMITHGIGELY